MSGGRAPSIRTRLAASLLIWALLWGVGVALAVGYAAQGEVDELLDESLQSSAALLASAFQVADRSADALAPLQPAGAGSEFAWQLIGADGAVQQRSANAPAVPFRRVATPGFSHAGGWRLFGASLGSEGRMMYVAHTDRERGEARAEVALSAALAALSIGLLGHWWLRVRVRHELRPLERLTEKLGRHDPLDAADALGPAERAELAPVHAAIDELGRRLAQRLAHERAFTAHAAHALRTPLAGMDAQLAVALRESTPPVRQRLERVREASGRLQRVVQSLLDLFRAGGEPRRSAVDLKALLAHLPVEGLDVVVEAGPGLHADPDLLAAALANLLDNAKRYGARRVVVSRPAAGTVRVHDDGDGATPERLRELRQAIAEQAYDGPTGLGLMLADLVARSHGGHLSVPETQTGFAIDLVLGVPG